MNRPPLRSSLRWKGHDYSHPGAYFITICIQGRLPLFGEISDGVMVPTVAGLMVESWWGGLTNKFTGIDLDAFVVMPNHVHGIVLLGSVVDDKRAVAGRGGHAGPPLRGRGLVNPEGSVVKKGGDAGPPLQGRGLVNPEGSVVKKGGHAGPPLRERRAVEEDPGLSRVVQWFKTMTTNDYIRGVREFEFEPFDKMLWQRGFYDHVIRNEIELDRIRAYIEGNPASWETDDEHPNKR